MTQTLEREPAAAEDFASGARVLSIGIASTGLFTFAYLATASHVLDKGAYSRISICWAIMFVILSVIYRPIEQLLSRTIADRQARGASGHILRVPALIQVSFALLFLAVALALRDTIEHHLFSGSSALYWILVIGVLAYAASYFARGWLAGHKRFALYGALVFLESTSRFLFALAVAVGIGSGQGAVGLGMAAAPFVSLCVIPFAFSRVKGGSERRPGRAGAGIEVADAAREGPVHGQLEEAATDLSLAHGTGFAVAVVAIMFSEQTLMNAGVLIVAAGTGGSITSGLAGFVFNVLLIVRAPLQLFQAIQTSILPHLAGMEARGSAEEFRRAVRVTILTIAAFAGVVAIGLLAIGPFVMKTFLPDSYGAYGRWGLAVVGIGMGFHLVAGTINQAMLARGRAGLAAAAWLVSAGAFFSFVATHSIADEVTRVEVGYCGAAGLLALLLGLLYRVTSGRTASGSATGASGSGQAAATSAA
jgi:O-antigen/teichoic acid export membrane protein